ncbi:carboxypeptidase-like regulatory domain-containing protein [Psychrobacter sp. I-STPA10]|uniref:carboxypeptidase-like regulatory domain-containing protein n=1 Tax=Psychrobacter sp. I-STPA10 TaxID=2585769 RepID=UPI001E3B5524|nr:carboxypeptidase-like regulatory domain-containing protein [Psychrobacter sp. I-STPA10]
MADLLINKPNRLTLAVVSILSAMALTACGGGGDGGGEKEIIPVIPVQPKNTWAIKGTVVDSNGNGLAGANVQLVMDREYNETTKADGSYTLYLPKQYKYPKHFAGVVTKQDYVPTTIVFTSTNNQPTIKTKSAPIRVVEDFDILFPASLQVHHLGDSNYTGSENSQFQYLNAHGKQWSATAKLSAAQKAKYNQLCIQGSYKGIQRPNEIIVSNGTVNKVSITSDTDPLGGYSELENCVSIDEFKANEELTLSIKSVYSQGDYDDFEFVNVRGVLKNSHDNNANTYNLAGMISVGNGGAGIEGFKVSVVLDGVEYSTVTGKNGQYILHLPKDIKYPTYFAGVATRQGYRPATVIFSSINNIPKITYSDVLAEDIDEGYVAIPNSLNVVHLGDSSYTGSENSQFQYANAQGTQWQGVTRLNTAQQGDYYELCLMGEFKGVQLRNKVILSTDKEAKHQLAIQTTDDSAADGSYTTLYNCFEVDKLPANQDIYVTIKAVENSDGYDDFEFINLLGQLRY